MSNKQARIISKLLTFASHSEQRTKIAAAICSGSKILSMDVNTHRNKYGNEIRCCVFDIFIILLKFFFLIHFF